MTRAEDDARTDEEIVADVREFYRTLMTPKYQWSRHNNAEFSLVVKALGQILGEKR